MVSAFCERPGNSRLSQEDVLANHTYSITEIAGSSEISHPDAIERAVKRASTTLRHLAWLEVKEQRAEIEGGRIANYQVVLKIGFRMDD
jgi:dodecin